MDFQLRVKCTTAEVTKITAAVLCKDITICRINSNDDYAVKCIVIPVGTNQTKEKNMNSAVRARLSTRDFFLGNSCCMYVSPCEFIFLNSSS